MKNKIKIFRTVCILGGQKEYIGYGSLLKYSEYPRFKDAGIPEIHDVWIRSDMRNQGHGTKLVEHLEKIAKDEGYSRIGIGVGLYSDYGQAQKLYCQMGYLPDGNGITYNNQPVVPGNSYPVDDDLVFWLTKPL